MEDQSKWDYTYGARAAVDLLMRLGKMVLCMAEQPEWIHGEDKLNGAVVSGGI